MAPVTERGYAGDFRLFRRWCLLAGRRALPASPATLNIYIADRLRTGKVASVRRSIAGIAFLHVREGFRSPADDTVRQTLRGASRLRAEQPRQMRPLTVTHLRRIVGAMDGSPAGIRNRAVLLLGFASGLRRSNLAALLFEDLTFRPEGVILLVRREKQNREGGGGRKVGVPFGKHPSPARYARCAPGSKSAVKRPAPCSRGWTTGALAPWIPWGAKASKGSSREPSRRPASTRATTDRIRCAAG